MFCDQCGKPVSDYAKYCRHCGAKLEYYKIARDQLSQQAASEPPAAPPVAPAAVDQPEKQPDSPPADQPALQTPPEVSDAPIAAEEKAVEEAADCPSAQEISAAQAEAQPPEPADVPATCDPAAQQAQTPSEPIAAEPGEAASPSAQSDAQAMPAPESADPAAAAPAEPSVLPDAVPFSRRHRRGIILGVIAGILVLALAAASVWFFFFRSRNPLRTELSRDWTQVGSYSGVTYIIHLNFDADEMTCYYEMGDYTEQIGTCGYQILDESRILLDDTSHTVVTIRFNDNRNMMTLTPGCLQQTGSEEWFNFDVANR